MKVKRYETSWLLWLSDFRHSMYSSSEYGLLMSSILANFTSSFSISNSYKDSSIIFDRTIPSPPFYSFSCPMQTLTIANLSSFSTCRHSMKERTVSEGVQVRMVLLCDQKRQCAGERRE